MDQRNVPIIRLGHSESTAVGWDAFRRDGYRLRQGPWHGKANEGEELVGYVSVRRGDPLVPFFARKVDQ